MEVSVIGMVHLVLQKIAIYQVEHQIIISVLNGIRNVILISLIQLVKREIYLTLVV